MNKHSYKQQDKGDDLLRLLRKQHALHAIDITRMASAAPRIQTARFSVPRSLAFSMSINGIRARSKTASQLS